jgi:hypothetical protein
LTAAKGQSRGSFKGEEMRTGRFVVGEGLPGEQARAELLLSGVGFVIGDKGAGAGAGEMLMHKEGGPSTGGRHPGFGAG